MKNNESQDGWRDGIDWKNAKVGVARASIHKTGRLAFNQDASDYMNLDDKDGLAFLVGFREDDENIYLLEVDPSVDESVTPSKRSGGYYYLHIQALFDREGIPYEDFSLQYDVRKDEYDGKRMWILEKRANPSKRKQK